MVFSSAISLFFFVPIVFLLDRRLSNVDAKNTWLLLASLVFYSFGQVYYLPLLLLSVALNYVADGWPQESTPNSVLHSRSSAG